MALDIRCLRAIALLGLLALSSRSSFADSPIIVPSGTYRLDPKHTSVIFKINHLGFSLFTGRFDQSSGELNLDPTDLEKSSLDVEVQTASVDTNVDELDDILKGENFFNVLKFPTARLQLKDIVLISDSEADVAVALTLNDQTHSILLHTQLIGFGKLPLSDTEVMGFTASGVLKRSAYGITNLEPFVGDDVTLEINCEFDHDPQAAADTETKAYPSAK